MPRNRLHLHAPRSVPRLLRRRAFIRPAVRHSRRGRGQRAAGLPRHAFRGRKEGYIPFMRHWDGGTQTFLNARFMPGHLIKNYRLLFEHGIKPQGSYLDVFGYVPPDEDFNPEHPVTRTDAINARALCYNWTRNNLGIVGTEAACDWTVPYSDISSPLGPAKCVTVPLFNLVYHDAIITPY